MGFEVYYHFREKLDGDYEKGDSKTFKKRVGDPFEEVPLEKLAATITAQLARRDIFISDVEVYELSKKRISFKETKGGIVIKNKKFLFDTTEAVVSYVGDESDEDKEPAAPLDSCDRQTCTATKNDLSVSHPHEKLVNVNKRRPIDVVVFAPEPQQVGDVRKKRLNLTVDKRYEVFEKRPSPTGIGELYVLLDDSNKEQIVPDLYFIPASVNLFGDKELGFSESNVQKESGNLLWGDAVMDPSMPNIRRR